MKIEEAIKEQELHLGLIERTISPKLATSMRLGIEGLKREQRFRFMHPIYNEGMLPGETKD